MKAHWKLLFLFVFLFTVNQVLGFESRCEKYDGLYPAHLVYYSSIEAAAYNNVYVNSTFVLFDGSAASAENSFLSSSPSPVGHYVSNPEPGTWTVGGLSTLYHVENGEIVSVHPDVSTCEEVILIGI